MGDVTDTAYYDLLYLIRWEGSTRYYRIPKNLKERGKDNGGVGERMCMCVCPVLRVSLLGSVRPRYAALVAVVTPQLADQRQVDRTETAVKTAQKHKAESKVIMNQIN